MINQIHQMMMIMEEGVCGQNGQQGTQNQHEYHRRATDTEETTRGELHVWNCFFQSFDF